ncbi:UBP-type zinc finger domain-containing protein [Streptomyces sp. NPDC059740]|uniref:UBP-type zinc finger domain-containing protein n=1 Tax=Streptomyces sp. NPDC059740 TaxID=3346926 RepID=UPI00365C1727
MKGCAHTGGLPEPEPAAQEATCPECLRLNSHPVQLRMCLECGFVGCCESSPYQHATGHFQETGHPVMRSLEPGESWRWCYVDARLV